MPRTHTPSGDPKKLNLDDLLGLAPDKLEDVIREQAAKALALQQTKSQQDLQREEMLTRLDELGGNITHDESVTYEGAKIILPATMEGNLDGAIQYLKEVRDNEEQEFEFSREFPYRPWDGAAAFSRAMQRVFGSAGIGKTIQTFFGKIPPKLISISVGYGQHEQVPWGQIKFSQLDATFMLGSTMSAEYGLVFNISVEAPRKHRRRIEGFMAVIEDELKRRSIYRGKMIDAAMEPGFINPYSVTSNKVVYAQDVVTHLQANVWTVIENADYYRRMDMPLKRAVLLEGPYGSGKSLAGVLTAQCAVEHGWTFILVRSSDDPYEALKTARVYAPAVVWVEDIDVLIANKSRDEIKGLLDALDSVSTKGAEVIAGYTTNFPGVIDRGVLRPGRLDAVIHIGELDAAGHERLIKASIPASVLDPEVDYAEVTEALHGYLPAFTVDAAHRAIRYAVARTGGEPEQITTNDLVNAAKSLRPQFEMASAANEATHSSPTIEKLVRGELESVLVRTAYSGETFEVQPVNGAH
jgi:ATPase family protein associated with various cellular activities (AAA)